MTTVAARVLAPDAATKAGSTASLRLVASLNGEAAGLDPGTLGLLQGTREAAVPSHGWWVESLRPNSDISPTDNFYRLTTQVKGRGAVVSDFETPASPASGTLTAAATLSATGTFSLSIALASTTFTTASVSEPKLVVIGGIVVQYTGQTTTALTGCTTYTAGASPYAIGTVVEQAYWIGDLLVNPPVGLPHLLAELLADEIADRIADVDTEEAARIAADTAEAATRASADTAEATARANADTTLTTNLAAEAVLARNADNLTSGTVADARITSTIARDSEVTALDAQNVKLTGDQTVAGTKTFSSAPSVPDASFAQAKVVNLVSDLAGKQPLDSDLTAIAALSTTAFGRSLLALADGAALAGSIPSGTYADAAATTAALATKAADSAVVHKTGDESIDGKKIGRGFWLFRSGRPWADPVAHGAVGDGSLHPLSAFYASLVAAQADYPHATSLTNSIDWAANQAAVNTGRRVRADDLDFVFADGESLTPVGELLFEGAGPFQTTFSVGGGYVLAVTAPSIDRVKLVGVSATLRAGAATGGLVKASGAGIGRGGWLIKDVHVDGNARRYANATVNGTTTLTTGASFFVPADAGKPIAGQYIVPGTTIAAYVSPTQVTLSQAASGSAAGVHGIVEGSPSPLIDVQGWITSLMENITTQLCRQGVRIDNDDFASNASRIKTIRAVLTVDAGLHITGIGNRVVDGDFEVNYGYGIRLDNASGTSLSEMWFEDNVREDLLIIDSTRVTYRECQFFGAHTGAPAGTKKVKLTASSPVATMGVRGMDNSYYNGSPSGYDVEIGTDCVGTKIDGGNPVVLDNGTKSTGEWDTLTHDPYQKLSPDPIRSRTVFQPVDTTGEGSGSADAFVLLTDPTEDDYVAFHRTGVLEIRQTNDPGAGLLQVYGVTFYVNTTDGGLYMRIRNILGEHVARLDILDNENAWSQIQHFAEDVFIQYNQNLYFKNDPGSGNVGFAFLATPFTLTLKEESSGAVVFKADNGGVRFFDTGATTARPTVTGSRGGNAALASLLTGLANLGLVADSSSA